MTAVQRKRKGPRVTVDCPHGGKHRHGTPDAYSSDGCRCDPCTDSKAEYWARMSKAKAYGRWAPMVPSTRAALHLAALAQHGVGYRRIAELSGVAYATVESLRRRDRIRPATEAAILAVPLDGLAGGAHVDGTGSRRRVQALMARGWSASKLAPIVGLSRFSLTQILDGHGVKESTRSRIAEVYERLWDVLPPLATKPDRVAASRSRNHAAARGWVPPLGWDDESIDDPAAVPAAAAGNRSGGSRSGDVVEDLDWLMRTGATPDRASERLGMSPQALAAAAYRRGRADLGAWVSRKRVA